MQDKIIKMREMSRICPRCKMEYFGFPALSRLDNETSICSECGSEEALFDAAASSLKGKDKILAYVLAGRWLPVEKYNAFLRKLKA